jgi:hypothetical protein
LLLQSNQFDTTWVSVTASVTSGQSGYDGSNDAWLLSKSAASGRIYQNASVSGVATYSVYAKSNDLDWLFIIGTASSYPEAYFNLSNGTIGNTSSHQNFIGANIEDVGNGWYRCSITFNDSLGQFRIYPADGNNDFSGTSGSIYIQDAQLEIGLVATEPILSGATTGLAGILEDSPRFDYSGGASCPSLLLEPSRTNLIGYSEHFDSWLTSGSIIKIANATSSPEGVINAYKIIPPSGTATNVFIRQNANGESFSVFAKAAEKTKLLMYSGVSGSNAYYDLSSGEVLTTLSDVVSADIESVGSDGWYRCSVTWNTTSTSIRIYAVDADNSTSVTGNGSDGLFIYGAQLEQGSYPTSYIPNHSGGSVTREADVCEGAGTSSTFNADEGVFYAEISTNTDDTDKAISLNNAVSGSLNNRLWMGYATSNKRIYALGYVNNSLQFALSKLMTDESLFVKIACRYKRNDIAFFVNGEKVGTDTSAINFTELTRLDFNIGTGVSGASALYGNVKQVLVFNSYLSDSEIITLTS